MKSLKLFLGLLLSTAVFNACTTTKPVSKVEAEPVVNPWMLVEGPALSATAEAIGGYSAGCLLGASELPQTGKGYKILDPQRRRNFGHPDLIFFIDRLAHASKKHSFDAVLVGDMAQPRGGPFTNGHASHQTGLDVDVFWYGHGDSVVDADSQKTIEARWQNKHRKALKWIALDASVERIFVDPVIKRDLCHWAMQKPKSELWLRKVRPWWRHHDHTHVRLKCPAGNGQCMVQEALPEGGGCGAELDWWFTLEAQELPGGPKHKKTAATPWTMPALPAACNAVIDQRFL